MPLRSRSRCRWGHNHGHDAQSRSWCRWGHGHGHGHDAADNTVTQQLRHVQINSFSTLKGWDSISTLKGWDSMRASLNNILFKCQSFNLWKLYILLTDKQILNNSVSQYPLCLKMWLLRLVLVHVWLFPCNLWLPTLPCFFSRRCKKLTLFL